MVGFDLAVPQSPVEDLQHLCGFHRASDGGDVTGPAAVGFCWSELLLPLLWRDLNPCLVMALRPVALSS